MHFFVCIESRVYRDKYGYSTHVNVYFSGGVIDNIK